MRQNSQQHAHLRAAIQYGTAAAAAWAAVLLCHASLLTLPYFWDEAGYYIPAAYDFFRTGSLIPHSTLTNAHPPLPSLVLATAWKLFGFHPVVSRVTAALFAAIGITATFAIARHFLPAREAAAVALLTAIYPVWFAQSTLTHADIFAAAFTLCALATFSRTLRPNTAALICFCLAALAKETAIISPFALFLWSLWEWRHKRSSLRGTLLWLAPAIPLGCWYAYHRAKTGFTFGNPEYLRYNATGTLHVSRIMFAVVQRAWHVGGHMGLWVPALITLALWLLPSASVRPSIPAHRRVASALAAVLVVNLAFFSVAGGALLTRYLLPLYPLVLLCHVCFWQSKTRLWWVASVVTAAAFIAGWNINPPYSFAPEDNLAYRDSVRLAQAAIAQLPPPSARTCVMTAWPLSDDLSKPELGYVSTPYKVTALPDLSVEHLMQSRGDTDCDHTILFSANPEPPRPFWRLRGKAADANREYFNAHTNALPETAARLLGESIQWQASKNGQWTAVLSKPAPVIDAALP